MLRSKPLDPSYEMPVDAHDASLSVQLSQDGRDVS
jgi:hypothetical protein